MFPAPVIEFLFCGFLFPAVNFLLKDPVAPEIDSQKTIFQNNIIDIPPTESFFYQGIENDFIG